jgi:hypothetical protein
MVINMPGLTIGGVDIPVVENVEEDLSITEEALKIQQFRYGGWDGYPNTYRERLMAKDWLVVAGEPLSTMAGAKNILKRL